MGVLQNFFGKWIGTPSPYRSQGSTYAWFNPSGDYDYQKLIKDGLWKNGVVAIGLDWMSRNWSSARLIVVEVGDDGVEKNVGQHPLLDLVREPHVGLSGHVMVSDLIRSVVCEGSYFIEKARTRLGEVVELRPWVGREVRPIYPIDGSDYLVGWAYTANGIPVSVKRENVVHVRRWPDREQDRAGWAPLKSQVREIAILNESSTYTAALIRNFGVPGMIATPRGDWTTSEADAEAVKSKVEDATTGEARGGVVVLTGAYDLVKAGWSPEEIGLSKIPNESRSQVLAAMGLNALAVGLGSKETSDGTGMGEAVRSAWVHGLMPLQMAFASDLTQQLLPDFEDPDRVRRGEIKVTWDWSQVAELEDREQILANRAIRSYQAGVLTLNESRDICGYQPSSSPDADALGLERANMQLAAGVSQPGPLGPELATSNAGTHEGETLGGIKADRKPTSGKVSQRTGGGGKGSQGGGVASGASERNGGVQERTSGAMGRSSSRGDQLAPSRAKSVDVEVLAGPYPAEGGEEKEDIDHADTVIEQPDIEHDPGLDDTVLIDGGAGVR